MYGSTDVIYESAQDIRDLKKALKNIISEYKKGPKKSDVQMALAIERAEVLLKSLE